MGAFTKGPSCTAVARNYITVRRASSKPDGVRLGRSFPREILKNRRCESPSLPEDFRAGIDIAEILLISTNVMSDTLCNFLEVSTEWKLNGSFLAPISQMSMSAMGTLEVPANVGCTGC